MKWLTLILLFAPLCMAASAIVDDESATTQPATQPTSHLTTRLPKIRIILVGDSTVSDKQGWGPGFTKLLTADAECVNTALGGRSSKSFRDEGHWDAVMKMKADYVLIQFGHNDEPWKDIKRRTDAGTEYRANMMRYVEEARAAGMKPVLVTSLTRRQFGQDGKIHSSLIPYVNVVKQIAAEMDVPLVDLHARSIALCESLGPKGCEWFSPPKGDGYDHTHLNAKGSELMAVLVADELRRAVPELAPYLKTAP